MNWALASVLLLVSTAAAAAETEIPRVSAKQLKAGFRANLHDLLSKHGLLRVSVDKSAAHIRRYALAKMCKCSAFADNVIEAHPDDMERKVLNDRTDRRTIGTASLGLSERLDLPPWLEEECGKDVVNSFEDLRGVVSDVVDLFVSKLDKENAKLSSHLSKKTYHEAMSGVTHLEHFHVYDKPSTAADDLETLKFHTDGGFFLAFVPSMDCNSRQTDNQSFYLEGIDKPLHFEDDEVVIMMGAASQYALNAGRTRATLMDETPDFVAAPHALRMKPGVRRAWYGKMHLLPASLDEPAESLPALHRDLHSSHRKLRAIPTDCNNITDFFCWSHCLTIPEEPDDDEDLGLYCVLPALVVEEPDGTSDFEAAYDKCGGGFVHNHACKGMWFPKDEAAEGIPEYDLDVKNQISVRVRINFDAYPEDISWTLTNTCFMGGGVLASGRGYDRSLFNDTLSLNVPTRDGKFKFTIEDNAGDGLCCDYLEGSYYVSNYSPWYGKNEIFVDSKMENPASVETSDFMTGTCPEDEWWASLYIYIEFDNHPEDISWEIRDTCRNRLVAASPSGGYSSDLKNQKVEVWNKPLTDGLFEFTIKDSNGDGLCCTQGEGGYEIYYALDGFPGPTITSKMEGVSEEKQYFGLEEHCPQYPDPDEPDKPVCRNASSFEKIAMGRGRTKSYDLM